ncbi:MAG: hypothetical protein JOZ83_15235, partial [Silvibacterium sp.]|nr:hypothetical protein [Silvibacterium sp.]
MNVGVHDATCKFPYMSEISLVELAEPTGDLLDFPGQGEDGLEVSAALGGLQVGAELALLLFERAAADGGDGLLNVPGVGVGAV